MMLQLKNILVMYGAREALKGISLRIEKGSIVTIIGPNGAGKSTTLKTICGTLKPAAGEIWFQDRRIDGQSTDVIVGLKISHIPEGRRVFPHLTVLENLKMGAYLIKDRKAIIQSQEMVSQWFPILRARQSQRAGSLSGGEQQMLAIARALMSAPTLVLMDEPTLGLSPLICQELAETIVRLRTEQGITILLVEQNARMALNLADRGCILEEGDIVLEDTCDALEKNERVRQIYLGE